MNFKGITCGTYYDKRAKKIPGTNKKYSKSICAECKLNKSGKENIDNEEQYNICKSCDKFYVSKSCKALLTIGRDKTTGKVKRKTFIDKTATKAFKQLNKCKLIYEKKQGQTKTNLIYVGKIEHDDSIPNMIRKNYDSRVGKNTIHDSENLRPNYNNRTKSNRNNFEQRDYQEGALDYLYANNWEQLYDN